MRRLREWMVRFGGLFNKERKDRELAEEIESHIQMSIEDNLRLGMTPNEARRQAMIQFGGIESTKETYRDQRGLPILDTFFQDIRYGARMLRKNPGFTSVAALTIALGIGANTAIFSIVKAMLLQPVHVEDSARLVEVFHCPIDRLKDTPFWTHRTFVAPADFLDWQSQSQSLESMAAILPADTTLKWEGEPERIKRARVSANFLPLLRINPILGRAFRTEEDHPGSEPVLILSHGFWKRRFDSDPNIIGKVLPLDEGNKYINYTVVGVMPPRFPLFTDLDLWTANPFGDLPRTGRGWSGEPMVGVLARLKSGILLEQAQAEMETIDARITQAHHDGSQGKIAVRVNFVSEFMATRARPHLLVLFAAVGSILLIACANVANLLLVRAASRGKEIAIRAALLSGY